MSADFYFDKVIQPGKAGVAVIGVQTASAAERERYPHRLATNDPSHPFLTFALVADVKRRPEIYSRLQNPDYLNGQRVQTFEVWPTARPFIVMEKSERLTFPLRVWRGQLDSRIAGLATEPRQDKNASQAGAPGAPIRGQPRLAFPPGAVNYRVRPGTDRLGFWIDIDIVGAEKSGLYVGSASITDPITGVSFPVELSAMVYEESLIVNPRSLDAGQVSLATLAKTPIIAAQLNVRKTIGSIHIKGVSSTLSFVKGGWQVLVDGSNYLVKIYVLANPGVNPGSYEGTIRIDTDDPARSPIEVLFKLTLVP